MSPQNHTVRDRYAFLDGFRQPAALQAWFDITQSRGYRDGPAAGQVFYAELRCFFAALQVTAPDLAAMRPDQLASRAACCSRTFGRLRHAFDYAGIKAMRRVRQSQPDPDRAEAA